LRKKERVIGPGVRETSSRLNEKRRRGKKRGKKKGWGVSGGGGGLGLLVRARRKNKKKGRNGKKEKSASRQDAENLPLFDHEFRTQSRRGEKRGKTLFCVRTRSPSYGETRGRMLNSRVYGEVEKGGKDLREAGRSES